MEISHVKVDRTERAGRGTRKAPRDVGGCNRGKVTKIRAKATAEWLSALAPATPLASSSCRLSRDSAGLIRSRGEREMETGEMGKGNERGTDDSRGSHLEV